jgi:hypothetical protein
VVKEDKNKTLGSRETETVTRCLVNQGRGSAPVCLARSNRYCTNSPGGRPQRTTQSQSILKQQESSLLVILPKASSIVTFFPPYTLYTNPLLITNNTHFFPEGGVGLVPKRGCLLTLAYYAFPRWYEFGERRWNDIVTAENRRTRRKTCPSATLSTYYDEIWDTHGDEYNDCLMRRCLPPPSSGW